MLTKYAIETILYPSLRSFFTSSYESVCFFVSITSLRRGDLRPVKILYQKEVINDMSLEDNLAKYIKGKAINLSDMSRQIGISYMSLYNSLFNENSERQLKARELVAVCIFLEVDPRDFVEKTDEKEVKEKR